METARIEEAIIHCWGKRCPDFDPECPTCEAWAQFDALKDRSVIPDAQALQAYPAEPGTAGAVRKGEGVPDDGG